MSFPIGVPLPLFTAICLLILVIPLLGSRATRTCSLSCTCGYTNGGTDVLCRNPLMDKMPLFSSSTTRVTFDHVSVLTVGADVFKMATNIICIV